VADACADADGGARPRERGAPCGSDLRLYTAAGIPALQYGPGDVRVAHSPRECASVPEVVRVPRALILTALRAAGVK
jgi:acetylornithine deacetylase